MYSIIRKEVSDTAKLIDRAGKNNPNFNNRYINNGKETRCIKRHEQIPEGWILGRHKKVVLDKNTRQLFVTIGKHVGDWNKGTVWIYNKLTHETTKIKKSDDLPPGFEYGKKPPVIHTLQCNYCNCYFESKVIRKYCSRSCAGRINKGVSNKERILRH